VREAAARLIDVNLVVNNAGVALGARLIGGTNLSAARQGMEINYFGLLRQQNISTADHSALHAARATVYNGRIHSP
jgi:NADP-dependent 3-hydroxy acid dehydrogenase YdfG